MNWSLRGRALGPLLLALLAGQVAGGAQAAPRVVSINLCADQLLLALAAPEQILGLSAFARDPARSWAAAEAARYPVLSGTAEEVLALKPDLVLAGRFTKRATREMLRAQGFRVVELEAVRSLDEAKSQLRQLGTVLGRREKAEAAVAGIDAAIARAREAASGYTARVLPLQRRGWISGADTLMTSLLAAVGLRNAGAELSSGFARQVSLEAIVELRPDILLVSGAGEVAEDQGSALLQHPALAKQYPASRRIVLPEKLTVCGGPMLADALDQLSAEMAARR